MAALFYANQPVFASDPCDEAGTAPSATIEHDSKIITVDGEKVTGSGVIVQFTAVPVDKDIHKDQASSSGQQVDDTFTASSPVEWSHETFSNGTFSSPNSLVTTYTTTTGNGLGKIKLKIKDDGTHFQDLSALTEKATLNLRVVVPDGARITSQTPNFNAGTRQMDTPVEIQVTYHTKDLPWVGHLAEKYKASSKFFQVVNGNYVYNAAGTEFFPNWNTAGDYTAATTQEGKLQYDNHTNPNVPVLTTHPSYVDLGGKHVVGFVRVPAGTIAQIQIFQDEEYLKLGPNPADVETAVHNEH